jgi:hypothetical protein
MSIFDESINDEENVNNENENKNKNKNNIVIEIKEETILKFYEQFLAKKRKPLSEEEKKERIEKRKNSYCKLNDEIILLFDKINNDEITTKNIIQMRNLLVKDLSDTKKITNWEALIFNKKNKIIDRLFNLTKEKCREFWDKLTDGRTKNGYAQDIKSNNISKAKEILKSLEEKKNENEINKNDEEEKDLINLNSKKNKTIKELIQAAEFRDKEIEKINEEILGSDNDISSNESEDIDNDSSNIDDKNIDIKNEEKEEKEKKENEEKKRKEKENKEKILKQIMEEKDKIDIFN